MQATPDKKPAPYAHRDYPKYIYTESARKGVMVNNPDEEIAIAAVETVYDNPSELPPPPAAKAVDLGAEVARLREETADLRQLNADLVARLALAAPAPEKAAKHAKKTEEKE